MNEIDFKTMLRDGRLVVRPLEIRSLASQSQGADVIINVTWRGRSGRFVATFKRDAKPLTIKMAIEQVRESARASGEGQPMLVAPYFSREKLDQLLDAGISAIDFCGNAVVEVPGEFLFYKTGNPNQYPDNAPIRSAYRGDGSMVARVLLLLRQFQAVSEIQEAIRSRGGALTLGMVSKVLKRLESDLSIERLGRNAVRVIQPERLLDGLLDAYQPPKAQTTWLGKVALGADELLAKLRGIDGGNVVRTGESSAIDYASWAGEPLLCYYCRATPAMLLAHLGADAKETGAFANLRLIQVQDQLAYFDARPNLAASPIQAYLEMASGDKRQKEVAGQIRSAILGATGP
ncbi:MAG: hypothetical protein IT446_01065 [Phycisphaerales bacterium]|nr:hypothetical protein [Phycisphaerales bacterium]